MSSNIEKSWPTPKRARIAGFSLTSSKNGQNSSPMNAGNNQNGQFPIPNESKEIQSRSPVRFDDETGRARGYFRREVMVAVFGQDFRCLPCKCCYPEEVKTTVDCPDVCQAKDNIQNENICCTEQLSNAPYFLRPHVRIPFQALCENHVYRLRLHQCCPWCGIFCGKGRFNKCRETNPPHYFHVTCTNDLGQCPHCLSTNFGPVEVDLTTIACPEKPRNARMSVPAICSDDGIRQLMSSYNEQYIRRHGCRLPGTDKEITSAHLADPGDRVMIQKAVSSIDQNAVVNAETLEQSLVDADLSLLLSLLAKNMDPDTRLSNGQTPLHYAASNGLFHICYVLTVVNANVELEEPESGRTALMLASNNGHYAICKMLMELGNADILHKDRMNDTALHLAAKAGAAEIVGLIINGSKSPPLDEQDSGGWTPLMWAAENGQLETVEALIQAGAKTTIVDSEGNIALHWAAMSGSVEIGRLLLKRRRKDYVDKQNALGYTPLMIACRENHEAFIELLLVNGADPNMRDAEDKTAVEYIKKHVRDENDGKLAMFRLHEALKSAKNAVHSRRGVIKYDLSNGKEKSRISVINDIDDETIDEFVYVTKLYESNEDTKVMWRLSPEYCCICTEDCTVDESSTAEPCLCMLQSNKVWYNDQGRLANEFQHSSGDYIYECNHFCRCSSTCKNRLVQRGITVNLKLMRTHGKGWGLFADEDIPKGAFVCEYAGELITDEEAEERSEDTYLFELHDLSLPNAHEITNWLCIDASKYGNVSRFINHGCDANLRPVKVLYDHVDHRAPHVAFFAAMDIKKDEELTFDYGPKFWGIKGHYFSCLCRSSKCRYNAEKMDDFLKKFEDKQRQEMMNEKVRGK